MADCADVGKCCSKLCLAFPDSGRLMAEPESQRSHSTPDIRLRVAFLGMSGVGLRALKRP